MEQILPVEQNLEQIWRADIYSKNVQTKYIWPTNKKNMLTSFFFYLRFDIIVYNS